MLFNKSIIEPIKAYKKNKTVLINHIYRTKRGFVASIELDNGKWSSCPLSKLKVSPEDTFKLFELKR